MKLTKQFLLESDSTVGNFRNSLDFFLIAISENNLTEVERMINKKLIDPNMKTKNGSSMLHIAVHHGFPEIVELLLKNGANPNIENKNGNKPIDELAYGNPNHKKIMSILNQYGAKY